VAQHDRTSIFPAHGTFLSKLAEVEDRIFTEARLRFWGIGIAEAWALILGALFLLTGWLIGPRGKLGDIDFCWMWVSGKFAAMPDPSRIYDKAALFAAHNIYYPPGGCPFHFPFDYPPTFLFFTYPLGLLPYLVAFAVWVAATLLVYLAAVYLILPRWTAVILAVTPFAVPFNISQGHNGFLTAGLTGLSLLFIERKPLLSGMFLGLLTYKPHFGVLFPLALLASRDWRALASAATATVIAIIAAGFAFGFHSWPAFFASLFERNADLSPTAGVELRLQSVYGLARSMGAAPWAAMAAHVTAAIILGWAVWASWTKRLPYSLKASVLCIGSVAVTPFVEPYDLCILSVAVAFFVRDGIARGFLPGERSVITICWVAFYFLMMISAGAVIYVVLLLLTWRRIKAARMFPVGA
jgi:hypothetical protein